MKYLFFFLLGGVLLSCANGGNEAQAGPKGVSDSVSTHAMADTSNYTSIQWIDSAYQDLGKIAKGGVVEVSWRFRNTGTKPLVIADVRPGCGCTLADRPDQPVAPGKDGVIKARYDTKEQYPGENRKNVTVKANTTGTSTHLLTFRVELTDK